VGAGAPRRSSVAASETHDDFKPVPSADAGADGDIQARIKEVGERVDGGGVACTVGCRQGFFLLCCGSTCAGVREHLPQMVCCRGSSSCAQCTCARVRTRRTIL